MNPFFLLSRSGSSKSAGDGAEAASSASETADPIDVKAQELVGTMSGDLQGLVDEDDDDDDGRSTRVRIML